MSGWESARLQFDLTPSKAAFYGRRNDVASVEEAFRLAGLIARHRSWGGWSVHATAAQIWVALSGQPSGVEQYQHRGAVELIAAGFFTLESYAQSVRIPVDIVQTILWPAD